MAKFAGVMYNGMLTADQCDCGHDLPLQVCQSAGGYYLGRWCNNCGPFSRESGYYATHEEAEADTDFIKALHEAAISALGVKNTTFEYGYNVNESVAASVAISRVRADFNR